MNIFLLATGLILLSLSVMLAGCSDLVKRLGFPEDAKEAMFVSIAFAMAGFTFVSIAYPKLSVIPVSLNREQNPFD